MFIEALSLKSKCCRCERKNSGFLFKSSALLSARVFAEIWRDFQDVYSVIGSVHAIKIITIKQVFPLDALQSWL